MASQQSQVKQLSLQLSWRNSLMRELLYFKCGDQFQHHVWWKEDMVMVMMSISVAHGSVNLNDQCANDSYEAFFPNKTKNI